MHKLHWGDSRQNHGCCWNCEFLLKFSVWMAEVWISTGAGISWDITGFLQKFMKLDHSTDSCYRFISRPDLKLIKALSWKCKLPCEHCLTGTKGSSNSLIMLQTLGANVIVFKAGRKGADVQNATQLLWHLEMEDGEHFWSCLCRCILSHFPESIHFGGFE